MEYRLSLMHKDDNVCNVLFNENGYLLKIVRTINPELLPLPAKKDLSLLKEWFEDRAVPKTRHNIKSLVLSGMTTGNYMLDNLGLSLTDNYWLKPFGENIKWKDINLYNNDFSSVIINNHEQINKIPSRTHFSKYSPDATTKGDLEKKWFIKEDGTRILVKGNFGIGCQQSLNEKFVTLINSKQNNNIPYTKYDTFEFSFDANPAICCVSDNFITNDNIEYISGYEIFQSQKIKGCRSPYEQFIDGCKEIGLEEDYVREFFNYEILLDYLITNTDRHFNNFGVIRDANTLKAISMAPIYDSGSSLFWNIANPVLTPAIVKNIKTHSFLDKEEKLLRYVNDYKAINLDKLPSSDELKKIYSEGNMLSEQRINFIEKCFNYKIEKLDLLMSKNNHNNTIIEENDYDIDL